MKQKIAAATLALTMGLAGTVNAAEIKTQIKPELIYDTRANSWTSLKDIAAKAQPGTIFVLGEQHVTLDTQDDPGMIRHNANQKLWLDTLKAEGLQRGLNSRLGLEFIAYSDQGAVDDFRANKLSEEQFLAAVSWGQNPFRPYRRLMDATYSSRDPAVLALNMRKDVTKQVARSGPDSLSPEQRQLLPPIWERGSEAYFERFADAMGGHAPREALERYFLAQSLWDDTMAWTALRWLNPDDFLTLVVGEFHVEFGHGLPARLIRHGAREMRTLVQIVLHPGERPEDKIQPDPKWGHRADLLWFYFLE